MNLFKKKKDKTKNQLKKTNNNLDNFATISERGVSLGKASLNLKDLKTNAVSKDGEKIPVAVDGIVLSNEDGSPKEVMVVAKDLRVLQDYAKKRLSEITPVLEKVAVGDFSKSIELPPEEDEFTEHLVAMNLMIDDFKSLLEEVNTKTDKLENQNSQLEEATEALKEIRTTLEDKVKLRTNELEEIKSGLENKVKKRTEELKSLNEKLEKKVNERTSELRDKVAELEKQRRVTVRILEEINEAKDELSQKYAELDVIKNLTQNLGQSLDADALMQYIINAIRTVEKDLNIAYLISPNVEEFKDAKIYVDLAKNVNEDYLNFVNNSILNDLKHYLQISRINENQSNENFRNYFLRGKVEESDIVQPAYNQIWPLVVNGSLFALINISSSEIENFNTKKEETISTIISTAGDNIAKLKNLIASEQSRLKDMVESMSNGVIMINQDKNVLIVNPSMKKIVGKKRGNIDLRDFLDIFNEKQKGMMDEMEKMIDDVLHFGKNLRFNEVGLGDRYYDIFINPVNEYTEGEGVRSIYGAALIVHDVTHRIEVDQMKTEFVSIASHQLRTPLTSIRLFAEMLWNTIEKKLSKDEKKYLSTIQESTERMIKLVSDLLNVTKLESGRIKPRLKEADIVEFIKGIIKEAEPLAENKKMKIKFTRPKRKINMLDMDNSLMYQVVHNLVTNAIRYSKDSSKSIEVDLSLVKSGEDVQGLNQRVKSDSYLIKVTDHGIGISKSYQEKIFDKFYRANNAIKAVADGSGLGLYVSKMMTELVGGKIWFISEEGKGTSFFVLLPIKGRV